MGFLKDWVQPGLGGKRASLTSSGVSEEGISRLWGWNQVVLLNAPEGGVSSEAGKLGLAGQGLLAEPPSIVSSRNRPSWRSKWMDANNSKAANADQLF